MCPYFWKPRRAGDKHQTTELVISPFWKPRKKKRICQVTNTMQGKPWIYAPKSSACGRLRPVRTGGNNCSKQIVVAGVETVSWERMWLEQKEVLDKHMGRKCSRVRGVLRPGEWAEQEGSLRGENMHGKVLERAWERGQWERMSFFQGVFWNT